MDVLFIPGVVVGSSQTSHTLLVNKSNASPASTATVMDDLPVCLTCSETLVQTVSV